MEEKSLKEIKKALRKEVLEKAKVLPKEYKEDADARIVQNLLALPEYKNAHAVFCFVGVRDEIDTKPFLQKVLDNGKKLAVPLCVSPGVMEPREINSLNELKSGHYGLLEPKESSKLISTEKIDFAVIPCLTADHNGNRLGHGGGYYDNLFNKYPSVTAAIICREKLITDELPLESFDHQFRITVTEDGVFRKI